MSLNASACYSRYFGCLARDFGDEETSLKTMLFYNQFRDKYAHEDPNGFLLFHFLEHVLPWNFVRTLSAILCAIYAIRSYQ